MPLSENAPFTAAGWALALQDIELNALMIQEGVNASNGLTTNPGDLNQGGVSGMSQATPQNSWGNWGKAASASAVASMPWCLITVAAAHTGGASGIIPFSLGTIEGPLSLGAVTVSAINNSISINDPIGTYLILFSSLVQMAGGASYCIVYTKTNISAGVVNFCNSLYITGVSNGDITTAMGADVLAPGGLNVFQYRYSNPSNINNAGVPSVFIMKLS